MILTRSPLRISFVGGGTDLPAFYGQYPGRVISATIDKYVYSLVSATPLVPKFTVKYQKTESVLHPGELEHPSIRAALLDLGITETGLEIGSFADLPSKTGLGSSSSFSTALLKGLHVYLGKKLSAEQTASKACRLEIDLLGEPIGKQDQYAAAYGGFNKIQFNQDHSVDVSPVFIDYKNRSLLEDHMLLFFTGITRSASEVLRGQNNSIDRHIETYRKMADSVFEFEKFLLGGDIEGIARMLHEGWVSKKSLAGNVSNSLLDSLYDCARESGVMGGKILGAGGGGCLLLLAPPSRHGRIREVLADKAVKCNLTGFKEIPVQFVQSGTDILFNTKE